MKFKDKVSKGYGDVIHFAMNTQYSLYLGFKKGTPDDVIKRALMHELGTDTLPQRSFIRAYIDRNRKTILNKVASISKLDRKPMASMRMFKEWLGEHHREWIKKGRVRPKLKPSTIARKGHNIPMIDSGEMWEALTVAARMSRK